jgi:hypothetical protein
MGTGRAAWREVSLVGAVMVIVALIVAIGLTTVVGVTLSSIRGAQGSNHTVHPPSASGAGAPASSTAGQVGSQSPSIRLEVGDKSVAPNEIVRLTGRNQHPNGREDLHVQVRRHGQWITFPLPAVTTGSGRFQSFVELAHRGANRIRVIDRTTGLTSNVATVNVS